MTVDKELRECREALVIEHMESENHHDFEATLGTFDHPRYEIVPTGDVFDGEEAAWAVTSRILGRPFLISATN